jgi:hypothetical protein
VSDKTPIDACPVPEGWVPSEDEFFASFRGLEGEAVHPDDTDDVCCQCDKVLGLNDGYDICEACAADSEPSPAPEPLSEADLAIVEAAVAEHLGGRK